MNKQIWDDQRRFNSRFFKDQGFDLRRLTVQEKVKWAKEFYFHISRELADLVNCLPDWKMHYKSDSRSDIIQSNIREEFTDSMKYLMGLGQVLGLSHNDILEAYKDKSEVVKQKYNQNKLFEKFEKKQVVIFDIDGVINTYPDCFLEWVYKRHQIRADSMTKLKSKMSVERYEKLKEHYRLSGVKKRQPVVAETLRTMKKLRSKETIILYTVRPVSKYKRIYSDTLWWLKTNKIPFEAIFWSDYHKTDIYKLGLKIKFIVEDDIKNTKMFNREGYKVYLIDKPYNQGYSNKLTIRVKNALEILDHENTKKKIK